MKIFAQRLRELRLEKELSLEALAREVDFSQLAIYLWESQLRMPNANAVLVLAKFFDVTTDYLLGATD